MMSAWTAGPGQLPKQDGRHFKQNIATEGSPFRMRSLRRKRGKLVRRCPPLSIFPDEMEHVSSSQAFDFPSHIERHVKNGGQPWPSRRNLGSGNQFLALPEVAEKQGPCPLLQGGALPSRHHTADFRKTPPLRGIIYRQRPKISSQFRRIRTTTGPAQSAKIFSSSFPRNLCSRIAASPVDTACSWSVPFAGDIPEHVAEKDWMMRLSEWLHFPPQQFPRLQFDLSPHRRIELIQPAAGTSNVLRPGLQPCCKGLANRYCISPCKSAPARVPETSRYRRPCLQLQPAADDDVLMFRSRHPVIPDRNTRIGVKRPFAGTHSGFLQYDIFTR